MMDNSLETYTARCQIMALHNSQNFDNVNKVFLLVPFHSSQTFDDINKAFLLTLKVPTITETNCILIYLLFFRENMLKFDVNCLADNLT